MITPRASANPPSPRTGGDGPVGGLPPVDLVAYQQNKYSWLTKYGSLNQEGIRHMSGLLKNAILSGQSSARLLTLSLDQHYTYSWNGNGINKVYNMHTLEEIKGVTVTLASRAREVTEWILEQPGMRFMCSTQQTINVSHFIHIIAIFIPVLSSSGLWNSVFTYKSLDGSAVSAWNEKCIAALRVGAVRFNLFTLYAHQDYKVQPSPGWTEDCTDIRHHLTMQPLNKDVAFQLNPKFASVIAWVQQIQYKWILTMEGNDGSEWAYFTILLDPLE